MPEIASTLEAQAGRPGMFSFEPGFGAPRRIADAIDRLMALPAEERIELREAIASFSRREWTWDRTAERLLDAARGSLRDR